MRTLSKEDVARIRLQAEDRVSRLLEKSSDEPLDDFDPGEFTETDGPIEIVKEKNSVSVGDGPDLSEQVSEKWARIRQKAGSLSNAAMKAVPVQFIRRGYIMVRFHLDYEEEFVRTVQMHQIGDLWVPCSDNDRCPACLHIKQRDQEGSPNPDKWRHESQAKSFCYATVFSSSYGDANMVAAHPVVLLGPYALEARLKDIVRCMEPEDVARFFNPEVTETVWEIRKNEVGIQFNATVECRTCEPLPEWYPALSKFRFVDGARATEEEIATFKTKVDAAYERYRIG